MSPGAVAFKKEVKSSLNRLSGPLVQPLVKKDLATIDRLLAKVQPEAAKLCRMCPFNLGVLDVQGVTLVMHPPRKEGDSIGNFSDYAVVQQTLKTRKIAQQRFFLQDGSEIYIICQPLAKDKELVGILALALSAAEAQKRWGIGEKEFLALDFNR